jgi:adenosylcobyric acid synthase
LLLDAEDAVAAAQSVRGEFRVVIPVVPRISNHTDFDALRSHPGIDLQFIGPGQKIPACDLIILPGSKNTRADMAWLIAQEWPAAIARHLRYGGKLIGICGGFQMLGNIIDDPHGLEGAPGYSKGLGLLDLDTVLTRDKRLAQVNARCAFADAPASGYEIHMGLSRGPALERPAFYIEDRGEGARASDDQILGSYLHGLFDMPQTCDALLRWAGLGQGGAVDMGGLREQSLDRIADACIPLYDALCGMPWSRFHKTPANPQ